MSAKQDKQKCKLPYEPYSYVSQKPTAQTCPVCYGKGIVPNGFYLTTSGFNTVSSNAPETCRSCGGQGIVWSR